MRARNQAATKVRPTLESLESRVVPASFTASNTPLPLNATSLVIQGTSFDPNPAMDTVYSETNGITTGSVIAATPTSLTVAVSISTSVTAGTTLAVYGYVDNSFVYPADVAVTTSSSTTPVVTSSSANVADSSATLLIYGSNFSPGTAGDSVSFNLGVMGSVTSASATQLTVTITTPPTALGSLTAVVDSFGVSSSAVQVATETNGDWIVNNSGSGPGSMPTLTLSYALNHALNGDSITFASTLSGDTITPTSTLTINTNLTIIGLGAGNIAISGGGGHEVLLVPTGTTASISSLTIEDGKASTGGGIYNYGTLTLANVVVSNNLAYKYYAGGIANAGELTIIDSTISYNTFAAQAGHGPGAGGGIANSGTLTLSNSSVSYNYSSVDGGGIANSGTMTIFDSTINGNQTESSGGGIVNVGNLTISNSTIADNGYYNKGGGILNAEQGTETGTLNLTNSTITGSTGVGGNSSYGSTAGGIFNIGSLNLTNSIVSGNAANNAPGDIYGAAVVYNSLIGNSNLLTITSGTGNLLNVDPEFAAAGLTNNGGLTETIALAPTSPALYDAGAITSVAAPIGLSDTAILVQNAAAIAQTAGDYPITIDGEEMLVTGVDVSTDTLTVVRGYNGTTAATHAENANVYFATDQRGVLAPVPSMGAYSPPVNSIIVTDPGSGAGSSNDVTLPYAVAYANSLPNGQHNFEIVFASTLSGHTITLTSTLTIATNINIVGLGAANLAVSGNHSHEPFHFNSGEASKISSLTIENGSSNSGGGIFNAGTLTLTNDVLTGNSAHSGAGIFNVNAGVLTLTTTVVSNNTASKSGAGIYNLGSLTVNGGSITGNTASIDGGGVYDPGTLTLSGGSLSGNSAVTGGAIFAGGPVTLNDATVAGNLASAATGIFAEGSGATITLSADTTTTISNDIVCMSSSGVTLTGSGALSISGNVNLGALGNLTDRGTGADTISGVISGSATTTSTLTSGIEGQYYHILANPNLIQPATTSNVVWLGNQVPVVTTPLLGPIDFPDVSENGFTDSDTPSHDYYDPSPGGTAPGSNDQIEGRWAGDIMIPGSGTAAVPINFETTSDDGSMLYIDGNAVVDNDYTQPSMTRSDLVYLTPGLHAIDIEYYQAGGGGSMEAKWDPTGGSNFVDIPLSAFYTVTEANYLTMAGTGSLTLTNAANNFMGKTIIDNGTLIVTTNGATGPANAAGIVVNGGSLALSGGFTYNDAEPISIGGNGYNGSGAISNYSGNNIFDIPTSLTTTSIGSNSGTLTVMDAISSGSTVPLTLEGSGTIIISNSVSLGTSGSILAEQSGQATITGTISGSTTANKVLMTGSGTLTLGTTNSYIGTTTIYSGTLEVTANGAMGPATAAGIYVTGGSLAIAGGINYSDAEPIAINGAGSSGTGAIVNLSGTNTLSSAITLSGLATIDTVAGNLTLGGAIGQGSLPNGLVDGNFSTPALGSGYTYDPTGSGWTFTGGAIIQGNGSGFGYPTSPAGTQSAALQDNSNQGTGDDTGSISQTFVWPAGTDTISFYLCKRPGYTAVPVNVEVNGVTIYTVSSAASTWTLYTTTFTTTGGLNTLTFSTPTIDNVDYDTGLAGVTVTSSAGNGLVKTGGGTLILANSITNTYTSSTSVTGGTLEVDGSIAASAGVAVSNGATLSGTGTVPAVVAFGGTVNPGSPASSTGTLSASSANFASGGNMTAEITNSAHDLFHVTNNVTLGGTSTLTVDLAGLTTATGPDTIISSGSLTGQFSSVNVINNSSGDAVAVAYTSTTVTVTVVPPPSITPSSVSIPDSSTTLTISGANFSTVSDSVSFNLGVVGTVTSETASTLTVAITTPPTALGSLTAVVTANGTPSGMPVQVATEINSTWNVTNVSGAAGGGSLTSVTLPYAVQHALSGDTISFASSLSGSTITLTGTNSAMTVSHNITIQGFGATHLSIDGNNAGRVFYVTSAVTGTGATISSLTIEAGEVTNADGGGIYNDSTGTLTLSNVTITDNKINDTAGQFSGGGIANAGTLTLSNATISGNTILAPAAAGGSGGGISNTGSLYLSNTIVSGNSCTSNGGGIANNGTMTLSSDTITHNSVGKKGGGISNGFSKDSPDSVLVTLNIMNSTVSNNIVAASSGGGIFNVGSLALTNSTLSGNTANSGGGLENYQGYGGPGVTATITNSTISGNVALIGPGGGIRNFDNGPHLTLSYSTVANNTAVEGGGGIYTAGATTMDYDTISGNSNTGNGTNYGGGGIDVGVLSPSFTMTMADCTVNGNIDGPTGSTVALGGGMYITSAGSTTLYNDTISGNSAGKGGGIATTR